MGAQRALQKLERSEYPSIPHWVLAADESLIREVSDSKEADADLATLGQQLRAELSNAMWQNRSFKAAQRESFVLYCARELVGEPCPAEMEAFAKIGQNFRTGLKGCSYTGSASDFVAQRLQGLWGDIFEEYCDVIRERPLQLSGHELAILAERWKIALRVASPIGNGEEQISEPLVPLPPESLEVTLRNPTGDHWMVLLR